MTYYLDAIFGADLRIDDEGVEFPALHATIEEARRRVDELEADIRLLDAEVGYDWRIEITDESSNLLTTVRLKAWVGTRRDGIDYGFEGAEASGQIGAVLAEDGRLTVFDVDLSPPAVEFNFVNPVVADGRDLRQREYVFTQHTRKMGFADTNAMVKPEPLIANSSANRATNPGQ